MSRMKKVIPQLQNRLNLPTCNKLKSFEEHS